MYCSTVIVILHETKLTASAEEEQQELLRVLEQTKRTMQRSTDLNVGQCVSTECYCEYLE